MRRWVSEGTRPRLPWGKRLDLFIRQPERTLALLEHLKDDPELYVRKSVANHLNDIAKDHPKLVVDVTARWYTDGSAGTRWIVQHALRTLVKKGDATALGILGFDAEIPARVTDFRVEPASIRIGEAVRLSLTLVNDGDTAHDLVIDFRVHFVKANGKRSPKVFKWTKSTLQPAASITLTKAVSMVPVTTRKLYPGRHAVDVQVNGQVLAVAEFDLGLT